MFLEQLLRRPLKALLPSSCSGITTINSVMVEIKLSENRFRAGIMETLTAAAIAILFLTKTIKQAREKYAGKRPEWSNPVEETAKKLIQALRRKAPNTASAIARVSQQPELAEQQPANYGIAVLIQGVESAAEADPEIAELVEALAAEVKRQLSTAQVRQVRLSGITVEGNLKAEDITQKAQQIGSIEQEMASNLDVGGDIELGNLTQEI
jgi:hypothetical protein